MDLGQQGALNFFGEEPAEDPPARTFGVYQTRYQDPGAANLFNLQSQYGTRAMPALQWINLIQTGQREYDENDPNDIAMAAEYDSMAANVPGMPSTKEVVLSVTKPFAISVGAGIGRSFADPYFPKDTGFLTKTWEGVKEGVVPGAQLPQAQVKATQAQARKLIGKGDLKLEDAQKYSIDSMKKAPLDERFALSKDSKFGKNIIARPEAKTLPPIEGGQNVGRAFDADVAQYNQSTTELPTGTAQLATETGLSGYTSRVKGRATPGTAEFKTAGYGAAGAFGGDFVIGLAMGMKPKEAAKQATKTAAGYYIGYLLGGPTGAFLGQTLSKPIGKVVKKVGKKLKKATKSVICNELERQGLMTRRQVMISYKFTHQHLSDQHERGYHLWAIAVVNQMRKGRMVKFWHHIATHRANEIEYFYGLREKPDYLGKLYRLALEPACWVIGAFCTPNENWEKLYVEER